MKYLFMLLCCVVAVSPLHAEEKRGKAEYNGAHLKFEESECNFGEILRREENKSCTFRFVNDGSEPLVILSATTSCSCLKTEFSRKPIAVGETGEIKVILESKKVDKGILRRIVQIRSNSVGGIDILTIKGVAKD